MRRDQAQARPAAKYRPVKLRAQEQAIVVICSCRGAGSGRLQPHQHKCGCGVRPPLPPHSDQGCDVFGASVGVAARRPAF